MRAGDAVFRRGGWLAALVTGVASIALLMQYVLLVGATLDTIGPGFATLRFVSYFTILCNMLVVLTTGMSLFNHDGRLSRLMQRQHVRGAVALYIGVTGIVYVTILRHLWQPQGAQWWADTGLHYATPLLYLTWWVFAIEHGRLQWRDVTRWLLFPLAYLLWTFLRGQWVGEYPYPFLDVGVQGMGKVLSNAGAMLVLFVVGGLLLVAVDRGLVRLRARRADAGS